MALRVLLVCTGNTCRSSMAEALLKHLAGDRPGLDVEVRSAGASAHDGHPASDNAVAAMRDRGLDLADHRSQRLTEELVDWADIILTMTHSQKAYIKRIFGPGDKVSTVGEYACPDRPGIDIDDPWGQSLDVYRRVAIQIEEALKAALERMRAMGR